MVKVNQAIDIYCSESKEILLFDDRIQVKSQKQGRQPKTKPGKDGKSLEPTSAKTSAITTDIVLLQKAPVGFEYIATPINATGEDLISLASVVKAAVLQEDGSETKPLNLVAITDGARTIRHRLSSIFGSGIVLLLDWYHLCKKLQLLMSMIAINQTKKKIHLKFLLSQLWYGKVTTVLEYLKTHVTARNREKLSELIGYLEKHQSEIINYDCRSRVGKTIGSGRMEKGVDLVVGRRQKHKAMSWRPCGSSKALALLKVAELNGQWQHLWFSAQAA